MGEEAAGKSEKSDRNEGNCQTFSESLAPLVGLGDKECGKEEPEVNQDAVGLDHAQLNRPGPER
ncbi:MAG TPA: hypothetical protein VHM66_06940 [Solirubrobacterales bacterium]|nr:hypothetical protein [Solirubrobacterales bacterium]